MPQRSDIELLRDRRSVLHRFNGVPDKGLIVGVGLAVIVLKIRFGIELRPWFVDQPVYAMMAMRAALSRPVTRAGAQPPDWSSERPGPDNARPRNSPYRLAAW